MAPHWHALLILTAARTTLGVQFQSVASVSPLLVPELGLSQGDLGTLIGLYFAPGILMALPGGALGRRFGDRRMVVLGLGMMAAGGVLTALAGGFAALAAGRLLSGAGAVLLNVLMAKMVTDWFAGRRGIVLAMAIYVNSFPIGIGLALLALGALAEAAGWGAALLAPAALALVALAMLALAYRPHPNDGGGAAGGFWPGRLEALLVCVAGAMWGLFNGALGVMLGFAPGFLVASGWAAAEAGAVVGAATWLSVASIQAGGVLAQRPGWGPWLLAAGLLGWAAALAAMALAEGLAGVALVAAGLVMGLPVGVILSLPSLVLRPGSRALGMGLFYTWLYLGLGGLPPVAGLVEDLSGAPAAPLLFAAAAVLAILPLHLLFRAGAARGAMARDAAM